MEACFLWLDPHVVEVLPKFGDTGGADPGLHVRAVEFFLEQLGIPPRLWVAYFLATLKGRTDAWQCLKFQAAVSFAEMRELFFGYFQAPSGFYSAHDSAVSSSCCLEPSSAMQEWSRALPALDRFEPVTAPLPLDLAPEPSWSSSDPDPVIMQTSSSPPACPSPVNASSTSPTPSPTFGYHSQQWSYPSEPIEQQRTSVWCSFCGKEGHKVEGCGKKLRILHVQQELALQQLDVTFDEDETSDTLHEDSVEEFLGLFEGDLFEHQPRSQLSAQPGQPALPQEQPRHAPPSLQLSEVVSELSDDRLRFAVEFSTHPVPTFESALSETMEPRIGGVLPDQLQLTAGDAIDLQVENRAFSRDDVLEETVDSDWMLGFFMDEIGPEQQEDEELDSVLTSGHGLQHERLDLDPAASIMKDAQCTVSMDVELLLPSIYLQQPATVFMPAFLIRQLLQVHVSGRDIDRPSATKRDRLSMTTRRCARNRLQQWVTDDELEENASVRDHGKDLLQHHESRRRSLVEHPPASLKASARRKLRRRNRHHRFLQHPACSKVDALHRWMTDDELEHTRWRSVLQRPHPRSKDVLRRWLTDDEPEEIITLIQPREQDARQSWILDDELENSEVTWLMVLMPSILGRLSTSTGTC